VPGGRLDTSDGKKWKSKTLRARRVRDALAALFGAVVKDAVRDEHCDA
jgi:hypothetical protein